MGSCRVSVTEIEAHLRESAIVENPVSVDSEIFEDEPDLPVPGGSVQNLSPFSFLKFFISGSCGGSIWL